MNRKDIKAIIDIMWLDSDDESVYCELNDELSHYTGDRPQIESIFNLFFDVMERYDLEYTHNDWCSTYDGDNCDCK